MTYLDKILTQKYPYLIAELGINHNGKMSIAKKMIFYGIDSLVLEGSEAGGHIGPVSINVLIQDILPEIKEVPVFVAGGIGRGEIILKFLQLGASGCQIGTRFVCATESIAHENFKKIFIKTRSFF